MEQLEALASERKIKIYEPFAQFLMAEKSMWQFEISLLDCYRFAGHACYAITGAYLVTEAAVKHLYPETNTCERGDLSVKFGSGLFEMATGPRSNVVSYITGSWGDTGFPGLSGRFNRKNLVTYGEQNIPKFSTTFFRTSNQHEVTVHYNPSKIIENLNPELPFPKNWREGIRQILMNSAAVISVD